MSKGIITKKPGNAGTTAGKILVTDPSNPGGSDTLEIGGNVSFSASTTANVGDLVDFSIGSTGEGVINSVVTSGQEITSNSGTVTVSSGQVILVNGTVNGKITVSGGILAVIDGSAIGGKLESSTSGSYILVQGATIDAKIALSGANYLTLNNSSIGGKVSTNGSAYTTVRNCTVNGNLEILNATECHSSGNTVDGQVTTSPSCSA